MATLGDMAVGDTVKLKVDGASKNFIVVHQGLPSSDYDSSCNGTWLLMENAYSKKAFDSTNHDYANSDANTYLNNTFFNLLGDDVKESAKQVKIPYTKINTSNGTKGGAALQKQTSGLSVKVFLLSQMEVLGTVDYDSVLQNYSEGTILDYFNGADNNARVAKTSSGTAVAWWLRTPRLYANNFANANATGEKYITTSGEGSAIAVTTTNAYIRPALILPSTFEVASSTLNGIATIGSTAKDLVGGYANIGGTWKEIVKQYTNIGGVWKE